MADAWKKLDDLVRTSTTSVEPRSDLRVEALGCERAVRVSIGERKVVPVTTSMERQPRIVWTDSGPRNVSTMREFAHAILDACDFVEECNPKWARHASDS